MPKTGTKFLFGSSVFCAVSLLAVLPWALHELKQCAASNITASSAEVVSNPMFATPTMQPLMLQLRFLIDTVDSVSCSLTMALPYRGETDKHQKLKVEVAKVAHCKQEQMWFWTGQKVYSSGPMPETIPKIVAVRGCLFVTSSRLTSDCLFSTF